jgi:hypothetical protein
MGVSVNGGHVPGMKMARPPGHARAWPLSPAASRRLAAAGVTAALIGVTACSSTGPSSTGPSGPGNSAAGASAAAPSATAPASDTVAPGGPLPWNRDTSRS